MNTFPSASESAPDIMVSAWLRSIQTEFVQPKEMERRKRRGLYVSNLLEGVNGAAVKVKVKMADYLRLHKIITGMNARSVWELLSSGKGTEDSSTRLSISEVVSAMV